MKYSVIRILGLSLFSTFILSPCSYAMEEGSANTPPAKLSPAKNVLAIAAAADRNAIQRAHQHIQKVCQRKAEEKLEKTKEEPKELDKQPSSTQAQLRHIVNGVNEGNQRVLEHLRNRTK